MPKVSWASRTLASVNGFSPRTELLIDAVFSLSSTMCLRDENIAQASVAGKGRASWSMQSEVR